MEETAYKGSDGKDYVEAPAPVTVGATSSESQAPVDEVTTAPVTALVCAHFELVAIGHTGEEVTHRLYSVQYSKPCQT